MIPLAILDYKSKRMSSNLAEKTPNICLNHFDLFMKWNFNVSIRPSVHSSLDLLSLPFSLCLCFSLPTDYIQNTKIVISAHLICVTYGIRK